MRRLLPMVLVMSGLTGCGGGPMDEADAAACDHYAETMQAAADGEYEHDLEFLAEMQRASEKAESDRLRELLDRVLEAGRQGDTDEDAIHGIRARCGLL